MDVPMDYHVWGTMLKHYQHAKAGQRNAEIKEHFVDDTCTEWFASWVQWMKKDLVWWRDFSNWCPELNYSTNFFYTIYNREDNCPSEFIGIATLNHCACVWYSFFGVVGILHESYLLWHSCYFLLHSPKSGAVFVVFKIVLGICCGML